MGFLSSSCFLEHLYIPSVFEESLGWNGELSVPCLLSHRHSILTKCMLTLLECPYFAGPPDIHAHGMQMLYVNRKAHVLPISALLKCVLHAFWTAFIKHKFKGKITEFQGSKSRAFNQVWGPAEHRDLCDCTGHTPMKPASMRKYNQRVFGKHVVKTTDFRKA